MLCKVNNIICNNKSDQWGTGAVEYKTSKAMPVAKWKVT